MTIIKNNNVSTLIEENTINTGETFTKQIEISSTQNLSATICWTDPQGSPNITGDVDNRTPRLRNNLDLKILKDGVIYYPWKLSVEDPAAPAINTEENDVDNVEKVEILNALPGLYTIQVKNKGSLLGGSQVFSLIANGSNLINLNTSNYDLDASVFIYPNPANNLLNFDIKSDILISGISIVDIAGKQLIKLNNSVSNSIDISSLSSGVYFITFRSETKSVTKKFIKQ